ncbi:MAG: hypothetical protein HY360_17835 [Verrucomicrobia bacterium]|nr:hypothetical protein [Verrucomicrobiota bacterium]
MNFEPRLADYFFFVPAGVSDGLLTGTELCGSATGSEFLPGTASAPPEFGRSRNSWTILRAPADAFDISTTSRLTASQVLFTVWAEVNILATS